MACCIWKVAPKVVHTVSVWVEVVFLIVIERIKVISKQIRIRVEEERHSRVHNVDSVDIPFSKLTRVHDLGKAQTLGTRRLR